MVLPLFALSFEASLCCMIMGPNLPPIQNLPPTQQTLPNIQQALGDLVYAMGFLQRARVRTLFDQRIASLVYPRLSFSMFDNAQ